MLKDACDAAVDPARYSEENDSAAPLFINPAKARANLRKHGVSFSEAETVFLDPLARTISDESHSVHESREITLEYSQRDRLLLVVHTEDSDGEIRIISARKADAFERQQYPLT